MAFALAAEEFAVLRQSYFKFPIPYLYEYEESVVSIAHELSVSGEATVVPIRVRSPDKMPLNAIQSKIGEMADADLWQRGFYRTLATVRQFPFFLRRPLWWIALNIPRFRKRYFWHVRHYTGRNFGSRFAHPTGARYVVAHPRPARQRRHLESSSSVRSSSL
jgi:hypothetical protein